MRNSAHLDSALPRFFSMHGFRRMATKKRLTSCEQAHIGQSFFIAALLNAYATYLYMKIKWQMLPAMTKR